MSGGLGVGVLSLPSYLDSDRESFTGYSYTVRVGFGLTPDLIVFAGIDGVGLDERSFELTQTNYVIGAQYFVIPRLYLRGGLGIASISEDQDASAAGQAFLGGIGLELAQGESVSFGVEYTISAARFSGSTYVGNALSFVLSFY
jgi:hypothetical protein